MAAGAVLVLLFGKGDWAVGWIIGGAFNIAYFSYLALIAFKRRDRDDLDMAKSLTHVAAGRFFVAIIFLLVVLKTHLAHVGATVCGLLSLKLVYYFVTFLGDFKHIKKR